MKDARIRVYFKVLFSGLCVLSRCKLPGRDNGLLKDIKSRKSLGGLFGSRDLSTIPTSVHPLIFRTSELQLEIMNQWTWEWRAILSSKAVRPKSLALPHIYISAPVLVVFYCLLLLLLSVFQLLR